MKAGQQAEESQQHQQQDDDRDDIGDLLEGRRDGQKLNGIDDQPEDDDDDQQGDEQLNHGTIGPLAFWATSSQSGPGGFEPTSLRTARQLEPPSATSSPC